MGVVTEGPVGSLAPIITLAAAGAGLGCVGGPGQEKHDVPSSDAPDKCRQRWIPCEALVRTFGLNELSDQKFPTAKK